MGFVCEFLVFIPRPALRTGRTDFLLKKAVVFAHPRGGGWLGPITRDIATGALQLEFDSRSVTVRRNSDGICHRPIVSRGSRVKRSLVFSHGTKHRPYCC